MRKKVVVSVINDLVSDQRVKKICATLDRMGFHITLIGRQLRKSPEMDTRPYRVIRMRLLFEKGFLFYAEYNLRLFWKLMFLNADLLVSNDLDTLLPNYLIAKLKRKPLVYDSHEYFTEVPELVNRPTVQKIWKRIERTIFPKLKDVITVNDSIAGLFEQDYGLRPVVVRNVPYLMKETEKKTRKELGLPEDKHLIILQGAGINIQRGAEEMVEAMQYIDHSILLIAGQGDVIPLLKKMVSERSLENKVIFRPRMPYQELMQLTKNADLGLTLDKDTNLNYRYSLPNKIFDYIQAGIPVIASPLPEIAHIINTYQVGCTITDHNPVNMAKTINEVLADQQLIDKWKNNCSFASLNLNWEIEEKVIIDLYSKYV
ncbi:MAG: glycosyltransferase [Bacteroidetes bacterium]|nr:glycosyltransferase [Bacteroidota bacterium]